MKRREAREKAVQTLFQLEGTELSIEEAMDYTLDEGDSNAFFEKLVRGTIENQEAIDASIATNLENWSLGRLAKVDRTILRLAVFELQFMPETPQNVVINEAIELSKTFGDDQSSKFVNGVLSKYTA
ncbi:transcription antitermination factor NusB [Kurthia senegalensis]|uniref:transcription antitermination factor NusB n=1 Tax=Kurthia senegalensis TaxID=1033740 RepID=UPI000289386A|nr:transcription antitermination factor NusB [Kurthia senegalensis]